MLGLIRAKVVVPLSLRRVRAVNIVLVPHHYKRFITNPQEVGCESGEGT
jgi:hypothetical protein